MPPRPPATPLPQEISLANITVPLESIKPSELGKNRGGGHGGIQPCTYGREECEETSCLLDFVEAEEEWCLCH